LNQGRFLGAACESVLPRSTRAWNTSSETANQPTRVECSASIRRSNHSDKSCEDGGQAHALNLGFAESTGEIMAWLNADDFLLPGSLDYVAAFFSSALTSI
jgi:hypothetical protein